MSNHGAYYYKMDYPNHSITFPCQLKTGKTVNVSTNDLTVNELRQLVGYFERQCNSLKLFDKDESDEGIMFWDEQEILSRYHVAANILDNKIKDEEELKSLTPASL